MAEPPSRAETAGMIERAFSIDIKAPIERVWREITQQNEKQRAMFDTMLEAQLVPGGELRYRSVDGKHTYIWGDVLESDPPRRLVHTFAFANMDEAPTVVTWELEQRGEMCRVTVTHGRFPGETKTLKSVSKVWPRILGRFKSVLERGDVPMGARMKYGMMRAMSFMQPKGLRTENVEAKVRAMKEQSDGRG